MKTKAYIPALRFSILTPLYDPFIRLSTRETVFRKSLLGQADVRPGQEILDFGCGTGTIAIMVKQNNPKALVTGIDVDEKIAAIAKRKIKQYGLGIEIDVYDGKSLPYKPKSFDKVISCLVFHHLERKQREETLTSLHRILKPGGEIHIADFGIQRTLWTRLVTGLLKFIEPIDDNIKGFLPGYLRKVGFSAIQENGYFNTLFGTLSMYSAIRK